MSMKSLLARSILTLAIPALCGVIYGGCGADESAMPPERGQDAAASWEARALNTLARRSRSDVAADAICQQGEVSSDLSSGGVELKQCAMGAAGHRGLQLGSVDMCCLTRDEAWVSLGSREWR